MLHLAKEMAIRGPLDIFLMCRARTNAISEGG